MTSSTLTEAVVTGRPAPRRSVTRRRRPARRATLAPLVLLAPAVLLVAVFAGYPLVRSIWFSLNDVSVFTGVLDFVGFQNFANVIGTAEFVPTLGRTAIWTFGAVALQLVGGLSLALMLNNRFPMRGVYRGLIMIPWATPSVLVALMWKWILDPNNGVLNQWLLGAGIIDAPIEFLSQNSTALPTLVMIDVWQGIPLFAIMILAALQSVSGELKESAQIDGCGPVSVFRHVVLPAILPTILITTLLRLIWTSNYVDLIFILTGGGPGTSSTTLALESYLTTYKASDFGSGAAYAVIQALFLAVFIALYVRLTRKDATR
ncbi:carbohydrate ABC transporter permease [Microbacterium sp. SA39]|uniref:carbohydrate ABC transporter permease n=1 Tax=Microbacterium sp. SA39 TaxID=1263625 RepID=UPI00061E3C25|nr:sugar ABC transporter permease [Microbacterium sp. SA39]KJQ55413.1 Lactose transport system permease protein LacF [Microbacterium sp. SA39]